MTSKTVVPGVEDVSGKVREKTAQWKDEKQARGNEGLGLSGETVGEETLDRTGPGNVGSSGVGDH